MSGKLRLLLIKCLAQRTTQSAVQRQGDAASRATRLKKASQPVNERPSFLDADKGSHHSDAD
jgi:hypothetical protein